MSSIKLTSSESDVNVEDKCSSCCNNEINPENISHEVSSITQHPEIKTFFSNIEISFLNLVITSDGGIPTEHFIKSCSIVITIFDMFRSPIFVPLKMDVTGNLKKLTSKYNTNPSQFATVQEIVHHEIRLKETMARNSGTDALLWLKRGLEFVSEFLLEFTSGNPDARSITLNAYNRTLKQYHGWILRGIITAATLAVPSRQEVLCKMALHPDDVNNPLFEERLMEDGQMFIKAMGTIITLLNEFFKEHNLDRKEVIKMDNRLSGLQI